ncbi:metallophosphoesterase [Deinococcus deserti]|uniref:Putative acid phosphatase n=1 Tax=Deinococcus deserti (strain DSM 17065 / CIP 109153 / LMG 22923 / VCD115) TaxID=546414 RepID=C1D0W1_DEIDV|nr:metallophosphoesterase [Deinococcus deserti]ACO45485.1 putative acid phosphatase [Deinococcus deserti VCD115]
MRLLLFAAIGLLSACAPAQLPSQSPLPDVVAEVAVPTDPARIRVVVMGDQGTGTEEQHRVAAAMAGICATDGCDLGVGLGDNFYPAGPRNPASPLFRERFADVYGPLKVPFLMVPGNHDESWVRGGDGADPRGAEAQVAYSRINPQWVMPARTYRAPQGSLLEFFAVDTAPLAAYLPGVRVNERPGGVWDRAQRAWLSEALTRSGARWKLVLGHHPLFSNGRHGNAGTYDNLPLTFQRGGAVRELYRVACSRADLLLAGHEHALQLFAPQPECPGTWTVVSGAAGKAYGGRVGTRLAAFETYKVPGFVWLDVRPDTLTVRFYTVPETGVTTLVHTQTLRK